MKLWEEIEVAQNKIQKAILRTPTIYSDTLSKLTGKEVFLKLENLQKTGSFKIRGAYYKLSQLTPSDEERGVVAASAGNHAQGVALASSLLGIHSTIVMPEGVSLAKQMATQSYGGEILLFGQNTDEALGHAKKLAEEGKPLFILLTMNRSLPVRERSVSKSWRRSRRSKRSSSRSVAEV